MRVFRWVVLAALVVGIAVGSLMSSGAMTRFPPGIAPGVTHLLAYMTLGGLMALALGAARRGLLLAFVLTAFSGMGLEVLQLMIPARTFSWFDLGMNVIGAAVGVASVAVLRRGASVLGVR